MQAVWRIGGWSFHVMQSASPLYQLHKKKIEPGFHYVIALERQRVRLYAEGPYANALRSYGYALMGIVHIGRSSTQELCLKSAEISLCHAPLQAEGMEWELVDQMSISGCHVNGDRVTRHTVVPGDVIYLGNVMLLMGKDSIFVPEQIADTGLSKISYCKTVMKEREVGTVICLIPEPTQKLTAEIELSLTKDTQEDPLAIFVLGPPIIIGLSSIAMGLFSFRLTTERKRDLLSMVPTLLVSLNMALGTIPWPLLPRRYERKQQRREEEK